MSVLPDEHTAKQVTHAAAKLLHSFDMAMSIGNLFQQVPLILPNTPLAKPHHEPASALQTGFSPELHDGCGPFEYANDS